MPEVSSSQSPVPSKHLAYWKLATGDWKLNATAPCTLRVCVHPCGLSQTVFFVVGKNYRLQDIQLSKSRVKLPAVSFEPSASGAPLSQ